MNRSGLYCLLDKWKDGSRSCLSLWLQVGSHGKARDRAVGPRRVRGAQHPPPRPAWSLLVPRARPPVPSSQARPWSLPKWAAVPRPEMGAGGAGPDQAGLTAPKLTRTGAVPGKTGQVRPRHGLRSRTLCSPQAQRGPRACRRARAAAAAAAPSRRSQPPPWVSAPGAGAERPARPRVEGSPRVWAALTQRPGCGH